MWTVGLILVGSLVICYSYWYNKWRNPTCKNGVLPPGSMGLPLIGETLELLIPSYSLDLHPFIRKRINRYGSIFRSSVAGRPIVVSADAEFNNFVFNQEGRLVEMWYMDTFSDLFVQGEGEARTNAIGVIHRYVRGIVLNHFGSESLKEKLLLQTETIVNRTLRKWSSQESVEVKHASAVMICDFTAKQMISYDAEKSSEKLSEKFTRILEGLMTFPLNIPGTSYYRCQKDREKAVSQLKQEVSERIASQLKRHEDLLDQAINDKDKEKFLSDDFIVNIIFGLLFASFESISVVITLTFKMLAEHPSVLQELTAEHEAILRNRKDPNSPLTWDEYKQMNFTLHVIYETLRLGTVAPGLLRRSIKDIEYKGYTIPAGWPVMLVTASRHLDPEIYKDPLVFNPWRWKDLDSYTISKNFTPFGGGIRQCAGAEYSKAFVATFLHVLVTKYQWTKLKGGVVSRSPLLGFGNGIHIKLTEKED